MSWSQPERDYDPQAFIQPLPVRSPLIPYRRPVRPAPRKTPGDPSCRDCRAACGTVTETVTETTVEEIDGRKVTRMHSFTRQLPAGVCTRHADAHYSYDPAAGVG